MYYYYWLLLVLVLVFVLLVFVFCACFFRLTTVFVSSLICYTILPLYNVHMLISWNASINWSTMVFAMLYINLFTSTTL